MIDRNETEYKYSFANGEKVVINLNIHLDNESDWLKVLKELDRVEYNNEQTQTRRHCSLDAYDKDERLISGEMDVLEQFLMKERWKDMLKHLTIREREVLDLYFCKGFTTLEIAHELNVGRTRITNIISSIRAKMKKYNNNL